MAHYSDLSFYRYTDSQWAFQEMYPYILLNVGWIECSTFPQGHLVNKEMVLYGVMQHCKYPVNLMMGFQVCPFCNNADHSMLEVKWYKQSVRVGNGEIWVKGMNNLIYVAPTMIYHYMEAHDYLPPPEFIDAVRNEPFDHFHRLYERAMEAWVEELK